MKLLQPPGWGGAPGKEGVLGQCHLVFGSGTEVAQTQIFCFTAGPAVVVRDAAKRWGLLLPMGDQQLSPRRGGAEDVWQVRRVPWSPYKPGLSFTGWLPSLCL